MFPIYLRKLVFASAVLVFAIAAATVLKAQQPVWPLDGPAFHSTASEIHDAAARVAAEKFADVTVLFERDSYAFDSAGRLSFRHAMIFRIEAESAIPGWSEIDVRYEPWHENTPAIRVRVIAPDGQVSELDQKTVTDGPASEQEQQTFTDARIHKAPLPNIRVGSIVEEESSVDESQPFFAAGSVYLDGFSRAVPVVRAQLIVTVPKAANFQYRAFNLPAIKIENSEDAGLRTIKFDQSYQSGFARGDIELPTHEITAPMVEFSTGASWSAIASGYRQLAEPQIEPAKVKGLVPASKGANRSARIRQVLDWLHKEVRYTGVEFGQAGLQPRTAAEVLERHFGDCKDKAALLVALLRADGIPAQIALLNTGPGADISPDLPGMSQFNHAIVYVPASAAVNDSLWIDATDEFAGVGTLPIMDQGRLALIVADGTTGLTETPTSKPEENILTELRDVAMADSGPARITETSLTRGPIDAYYRRLYGGEESRQLRTNLENYAKNYYMAQTLATVEHGDNQDLTKPFALKLVMDKSRRANTSTDDATVSIPFFAIFGRLAEWFRTDPEDKGDEQTPQQQEDRKRAEAARVATYDVTPQTTEWRYTITPAVGYMPRVLPEDKVQQMGLARLTFHYSADASGVVTAVLRFDTVKPRYTQAEALALRDAVLATYSQDAIQIMFDQVGAKLMAAGKIREALDADRALIAQHPQQAVQHAHIAYVLLKAGLGDLARKEAKLATTLDPNSAMAFKTLGWMCEFNVIGVHWGYGSDRDCADRALVRSLELNPDDLYLNIDLAYAQEYSAEGERYTPGAHLESAIKTYRFVREKNKAAGDRFEDDYLRALLYAGHYSELLDEVAKISSSTQRSGLAIAATAASQRGEAGIKAALAYASHLSGSADDRTAALKSAGLRLGAMRMYPESKAILAAGAQGQTSDPSLAQQVRWLGNTAVWNGEYIPDTDPRSVAQKLHIGLRIGTFTPEVANTLFSSHSFASEDERKMRFMSMESPGHLLMIADRDGISQAGILDHTMGNITVTAEGNDQTGYKVIWQQVGVAPDRLYVVKEDGHYTLTSDGTTFIQMGNHILYLLDQGRNDEARAELDWERGKLRKDNADDPLAGFILPMFWTVCQKPDPAAMRRAALSLTPWGESIRAHIGEIHDAWKNAATDEARAPLALVAANGYLWMHDGAGLKEVAADLRRIYPDSEYGIDLAAKAEMLLNNNDAALKILNDTQAMRPDDDMMLRYRAQLLDDMGDYPQSRAAYQRIIDMGKGSSEDYNNYAWSTLFDGKVDDLAVKYAEQAADMQKNSDFSSLHTLACVYAYRGRTTEAHDLILKAMKGALESVPGESSWLAWGLIYEQYGMNDAAIEAYHQLKKYPNPSPRGSWALAQTRLKAIEAQSQKPVESKDKPGSSNSKK